MHLGAIPLLIEFCHLLGRLPISLSFPSLLLVLSFLNESIGSSNRCKTILRASVEIGGGRCLKGHLKTLIEL